VLKFSANLSLLFTELPLAERFAAAKQAGFDAVEVQFPYELSAQDIAERLRESGAKLVLFNVPAGDLLEGGEGLAAVPERREAFYQAVEQARQYVRLLRPRAINILPGRCLDLSRAEAYRHTLLENLRYAANAFAEEGVLAVFEAINTFDMPGFLIHRGQHMLDCLAALAHPNLAMQYDAYHMARMGENPAQFIAEHAGQIGHIQFADVPGRGQPGSGSLDFPGLFSAVRASGYDGYLGAEYRPQGGTQASLSWLAEYA
jgi:hydroxypyruvate isomerase